MRALLFIIFLPFFFTFATTLENRLVQWLQSKLFAISFKWTRVLISAITVADFFGWIYRFANLSFIVAGEISNCNCRNKNSCPLEGDCKERNIVYQAEVTTPQSKETYIGLCDTTFKERYRNHTCSFRNERYKNATELSKYIWSLKNRKINYDIRWRKIRQARSYSNINKKCNLCLCEKYFIICKPEMSTLNHRNEMTSICRHSKKFLLNTVLA